MKFQFKVEEEDFLEYQLFTSSKSKQVQKKKRYSWVLLTVISIILAIYFYSTNNTTLTIYFCSIAAVCALFYSKYFKWRYKKHYKNFIKRNYSSRFGEVTEFEFTEEFISTKDKVGESKIELSEIKEVNETKKLFLIKIQSGLTLIIPKRELQNLDSLKQKFNQHQIIIKDELNWKW